MQHSHNNNMRRVTIALVLTATFMLVEVAGGILSGSLALLADAGHMLTDFASLSLAWIGFRLARRPADWRRTYGFDRFSILVAFVNGITLFAIAAWISFEAILRLREPNEVMGGLMLWVALAGLAVNALAFWILTRGDRENLNIRAATLHVAGDLLGSVAAVIASLVIIFTGFMPIDPLLSIVVALIIVRSAWRVVCDAGHILLEGSPAGFDARAAQQEICSALPYVLDIHHLHAWSISEQRPMVTLHACVENGTDSVLAAREIKKMLAANFSITHATVEVEYDTCLDELHTHGEAAS
jgi:cobalt-zinc-cadmium efflux system protein